MLLLFAYLLCTRISKQLNVYSTHPQGTLRMKIANSSPTFPFERRVCVYAEPHAMTLHGSLHLCFGQLRACILSLYTKLTIYFSSTVLNLLMSKTNKSNILSTTTELTHSNGFLKSALPERI